MPFLNTMLIHPLRLFSLFLLLAACSYVTAEPNKHLLSTIRPLDLLVGEFIHDNASHSALLNAQQSPHQLQLKPSQRKKLQQATSIFWFGSELEPMMLTILSGDRKLTDRALNLKPQAIDHDHDHHEDDHSNPHYWLNRNNVIETARMMSISINQHYPELAGDTAIALSRLSNELFSLEEELELELNLIQSKKYLDLHDAWELLAEDFQLKQFHSIEHQALEFVGAKSILKLKREIDNASYDCIIASPETNLRLAQNLVSNSNTTRLIILDPLANDLPEDSRFIDLLKTNIKKMADC